MNNQDKGSPQTTQQKVCFSYVRFSTKRQGKEFGGTSEERQLDGIPQLVKEKGWVLRDDWAQADLGKSGFKKLNLPTLIGILDRVKAGEIPQGTVMIIERIDRFTRAPLDEANEFFLSMLRAGLEIYNRSSGQHYDRSTLDNEMQRSFLLFELKQAWAYSDTLSKRVKAAIKLRNNQILKGEVLKVKNCPSWIDSETWGLNHHAETVRAIYHMYLLGMGGGSIARKLNADKVPTFSGKGLWEQPTVFRLLENRQVLGEIQVNGETVNGYYPQCVDEETFLKVQSKRNDNQGKRPTGNTDGNITNLFSGVAFCSCGEAIKVHRNGIGNKYISCWGKHKGTDCKTPQAKYDVFEKSFTNILNLSPEQLIRDENGNGSNVQTQILKGRLSEVEKQIANITEALSIQVTKALVIRQGELETAIEEIKAQIQLESAKTVATRNGVEKLETILNRIDTLTTDNEFRVTVQGWIRETVERIDLNTTTKTFTVQLKTGNVVTMGLDGTVRDCKSFTSLFTGQPLEVVETVQAVG